MKIFLCAMILAGTVSAAMGAEKPRAMFGVVTAENPEARQGGVLVQAVSPGSPAEALNLKPGDRIESLNGQRVNSREEMRSILRGLAPGMAVELVYYSAGSPEPTSTRVTLAERPARVKSAPDNPGAAVGGDRMLRPLVVNPEIRAAMRTHRRAVMQQLAAVDAGFSPQLVTEHLQAIRHLARDANPRGRGWMLGEAGEVSLQFRDAEGILVLHGANKQLTLTVYDSAGIQTHSLSLNTPDERSAVPAPVIERLRRLR